MESTDKTTDVNETVEQIRTGAHSAVDKAADATVQAAEVLGQKGEQLRNAEQECMEQCRSYIHERPFTAVGLALGAGFLLSRLLDGR
jgi:ElaB/YqjD/DUF883 family membrane-anchored ribosome-binding protein